MANFICFASTEFIRTAVTAGVYGNVGNRRQQDLWSILRDVIAVKPGDSIFFYETGGKRFHGVFEATSEPFFCDDNLFQDPRDSFPFRFSFRRRIDFPKPVPDFEFIHMVDRKIAWSLGALQKDPTGPFRSIVNVSDQEKDALIQLFRKYNTDVVPIQTTAPIVTRAIMPRTEAINIITANNRPTVETAIDLTVLPTVGSGESLLCQYEYALQAYIAYILSRRTSEAISLMGDYRESLTEVPLSAAEPRRIDVLCTYQVPGACGPYFYILVELKARATISAHDLSQILGYIRIFTQKKGVEFGDVGGAFVAPAFSADAITYAQQRLQIEVEKPLRLIEYNLTQSGAVTFTPVM